MGSTKKKVRPTSDWSRFGRWRRAFQITWHDAMTNSVLWNSSGVEPLPRFALVDRALNIEANLSSKAVSRQSPEHRENRKQ